VRPGGSSAELAGNEPERKLLVASDHEAIDPLRSVFGVECKTACAFEEHGQHDARLHAGKRRPDAVVDAAPE
jgi:hypothetical protein